jgi:DNA-binding NtrC family response regulator
MSNGVKVLIVDDEASLRDVLSVRLEHWGYSCRAAADVQEAESLMSDFDPDLVLSDVVMPEVTGIDLLRRLRARGRRRLPVILMTAHGTVDNAVNAMKEGAVDFLTKPLDNGKLHAVLEFVAADLRRGFAARALEATLERNGPLSGLVGQSAPMRELQQLIRLVASSDAAALITGESGTGKEVVARAIHDLSARKAGPWMAVNAAAIPESLIESELFGHERGAFTGAIRSRPGCFEQADGGTLFLDEIAEMPVSLQPKLLRILESGRVRRLGGSRELPFAVRVLAASNRSLVGAMEAGLLREDLYYRLNVFEIALPALRDRLDDLPLLCQHFVREFNEKHGTEVDGLREATMQCLLGYRWPGNVRELRNLMERAVIVARSGWLDPTHFPIYLREAPSESEPMLMVPVGTPAAEAERQLILRTLESVGNNKAEAARRLRLDVKTIRNKLRAFERDLEP